MNPLVEASVTAALGATSPRVLVIEDDPVQRAFLRLLLQRAGVADVAEAGEGQRALDVMAAARAPFDIAFCDLNMPNMDGMALLSRVARVQPAPAIVLSSALDNGLIAAVELMARELGLRVLGILPKPPRLEQLLALLRLRRAPAPRHPAAGTAVVTAAEVAAALAADDFVPFFQPKVRLSDGVSPGAEILVRWAHPGHGLLAPAAFLPQVAAVDGYRQITLNLLEKAIPVLLAARRRQSDYKLALNVETSSLVDRGFCEALAGAVKERGCEPSWFTIEITEGQALGDLAFSLEQVARLRMQGFGLSLDDFGTGYSSLQQLSRLPFTEIKLDRSFVHGAHCGPSKRIVANSCVDLAARMGMRVVAEGIEDQADLDFVRGAGFDEVQGFVFARPLTGPALLGWLDPHGAGEPAAASGAAIGGPAAARVHATAR